MLSGVVVEEVEVVENSQNMCTIDEHRVVMTGVVRSGIGEKNIMMVERVSAGKPTASERLVVKPE